MTSSKRRVRNTVIVNTHRCRGQIHWVCDAAGGLIFKAKRCTSCQRWMSLGRAKHDSVIRGVDIVAAHMIAMFHVSRGVESARKVDDIAIQGWRDILYRGNELVLREHGRYDAGWLASEAVHEDVTWNLKTLIGVTQDRLPCTVPVMVPATTSRMDCEPCLELLTADDRTMSCPNHGKLDLIAMLCEMVSEAGGVMRLHGKPIDADGLRAAARNSFVKRTTDTIMKNNPDLSDLVDTPKSFDLAVQASEAKAKEANASGFVAWPSDQPKQYNGSGEPCDMWEGPCLCGAWHRDGR